MSITAAAIPGNSGEEQQQYTKSLFLFVSLHMLDEDIDFLYYYYRAAWSRVSLLLASQLATDLSYLYRKKKDWSRLKLRAQKKR